MWGGAYQGKCVLLDVCFLFGAIEFSGRQIARSLSKHDVIDE